MSAESHRREEDASGEEAHIDPMMPDPSLVQLSQCSLTLCELIQHVGVVWLPEESEGEDGHLCEDGVVLATRVHYTDREGAGTG